MDLKNKMMGDAGGYDDGSAEKSQDKSQGETNEPVQSILIEAQGDGSFKCTVTGQDGTEQSYDGESFDQVLQRVKDDLGSPHMKEHGTFASLRNKIMNRPGFKPRYPGQSKEQAANAVTAHIKDLKYGKSWRHDRG